MTEAIRGSELSGSESAGGVSVALICGAEGTGEGLANAQSTPCLSQLAQVGLPSSH